VRQNIEVTTIQNLLNALLPSLLILTFKSCKILHKECCQCFGQHCRTNNGV